MKDLDADGWPEILINSPVVGSTDHTLYAYTIPKTTDAIESGDFEDFLIAENVTSLKP